MTHQHRQRTEQKGKRELGRPSAGQQQQHQEKASTDEKRRNTAKTGQDQQHMKQGQPQQRGSEPQGQQVAGPGHGHGWRCG